MNGTGKIGLAVAMTLVFAQAPGAGAGELFLIDDFSSETSTRGTSWEGFTDRVMGGVSDIDSGVLHKGDESFLYLRGNVSLKNNGGFIQVRLKLDADGKPFDAGGYTGVALRVRGRGPGYYVHLRTTRIVFPWSFFGQEFKVSEDWSMVYLPFAAFQSENMASSRVNPRKLISVAIVAAKREFAADLYVDSISWYR